MVEEEKGDEEWTDAEMHSQKLEPEAGRQPDKRQKHRGRRVHQVEERNEERRRAKQRIRVERGGRMNGMVGVVLDPGPRTKNQEPRTKKPGGPKDPRAKDGLVGWDHEPGSENREEEGRRMGEMGRHGGDGGWGRVEEGDESEDWSHRRARDDAREARASASRPTAGKREQSRARQSKVKSMPGASQESRVKKSQELEARDQRAEARATGPQPDVNRFASPNQEKMAWSCLRRRSMDSAVLWQPSID
ncbi:hypothetical protein H634G_02826 [Metarhizium anisopliae BRIP 53293]|uniref:Uncharacterized protein n=1 Tax=Metarhizium anisopliae BRIP 53293 TaxID=1291518 RepID=A0A0D9P661_METAN|nr:hypothetical protein H634G_02826 [Metarhizium anisopliae BRIP 53293]KJK91965.1 hypothetical protein H633G_04180 [Metarhizium anisopliae BRIP 53284]